MGDRWTGNSGIRDLAGPLRKGYEIWDGWIIAAIILWAIATELGRRAQVGFTAVPAGGEATSATSLTGQTTLMHWLRSLAVLALLVVMIYKPGA